MFTTTTYIGTFQAMIAYEKLSYVLLWTIDEVHILGYGVYILGHAPIY